MSLFTRAFAGALLLVLGPARLAAQERELNGVLPLGVRVHVRVAAIAGDTTALEYTVENVRQGGEDLWGLLVATPAPVVRMPKPAALRWGLHRRYRKQAIVGWIMHEDTLVRPGRSTPPLRLEARGVAGLVRYWAVPDLQTNPPVYSDDEGPPRDNNIAFSDSGVTVGVVAIPTGATTASLSTRLRSLLGRTCTELGWITNHGVCHSLDVKLANAEQALAAGNRTAARGALTAFANELDAQHGEAPGKHVNDTAYALLSANATFLIARL